MNRGRLRNEAEKSLRRGAHPSPTARLSPDVSRRCLYLALALAITAMASVPAGAQALPGTPDTQTSSARADSSKPAATSAKGISVIPGVSLGATWDSNVFATRDAERDDVLTSIAPYIDVTGRGDAGSFEVEAGGTATRYRTYTHENSNDRYLDVSGSLKTGSHGSVFGGAGYALRHEDRTSPDNVFGIEPTIYSDTHAHAGVRQSWGGFTLRVGGTVNHLRFHDVPNASGALINNRDRNRDVTGLGARLSRTLSGDTSLFVQLTHDRRQYLMPLDDYGFRRDSNGDGWALGLARGGRGNVRGEIYLGRRMQRYVDPRLPNVSAPTFGAELNWTISRQTTLEAFAERSIEETTVPGASAYVDTVVGLHARRTLSPRLSANARVGFTRSDFRGITRRDDLGQASVGFSYLLANHVFLDAEYRQQQRHSDVPSAQYFRNLVYVGLRLDGAKPRVADATQQGTPPVIGAPAPGGLYAGLGVGYAVLDTHVTSPRGEHGFDGGDFGAGGATGSVFAGYGWMLDRTYIGLEASASAADVDWLHVKSPDSRIYSVHQHRTEGVAFRLGRALAGRTLAYVSVGRERTRFDTAYVTDTGIQYDYRDARYGTRYGVGMDLPISAHGFVRARYDIVRYGGYDVAYDTGVDRFASDSGRFQMGLGWRLGAADRPQASRRASASGFYVGAQGGDERLDTRMNATHRQAGPPQVTRFSADFGNHGKSFGAFAGYGHAFGWMYAGVELEADASNVGWFHVKEPGGRDFSVEHKGGYGASLRLGYVTRDGAIIYLRGGRVQGRFITKYVKGGNSDAWVDRNDAIGGTRLGIGVSAPLGQASFLRFDYTTTRYAGMTFTTTQSQADDVGLVHHQHLFRIGVGMRF